MFERLLKNTFKADANTVEIQNFFFLQINLFYAIDLFVWPLKTSENLWGYRKRSVA